MKVKKPSEVVDLTAEKKRFGTVNNILDYYKYRYERETRNFEGIMKITMAMFLTLAIFLLSSKPTPLILFFVLLFLFFVLAASVFHLISSRQKDKVIEYLYKKRGFD